MRAITTNFRVLFVEQGWQDQQCNALVRRLANGFPVDSFNKFLVAFRSSNGQVEGHCRQVDVVSLSQVGQFIDRRDTALEAVGIGLRFLRQLDFIDRRRNIDSTHQSISLLVYEYRLD